MESWSFLTNNARVLLCIAHDPGARLCDIGASLGITDRSAHGIITEGGGGGWGGMRGDWAGRASQYQHAVQADRNLAACLRTAALSP